VLPVCLHKLRGDLGPADPEVNCTFDESIEFRLGCIPRRTSAPKALRDLAPDRAGERCSGTAASIDF
jgi:hypothetical protein